MVCHRKIKIGLYWTWYIGDATNMYMNQNETRLW